MSRILFFFLVALSPPAVAADAPYMPERPPEVRIVETELDGPVFADARGRTLYNWSRDGGNNQTPCLDVRIDVATGGQGTEYRVPDSATLTCMKAWPPLVAKADAQPVGAWTVFTRQDGVRQWAYNGRPVYTSHLDRNPGEVNGTQAVAAGGAVSRWGRYPLRTDDGFPPGVTTVATTHGRALANDAREVLYANARCNSKGCDDSAWRPFTAPSLAQAAGDWTIKQNKGVRQWAYKGKLLYAFVPQQPGQTPEDESHLHPGWAPALYKALPAPPAAIGIQITENGEVYADRAGKTLYIFHCMEETPDDVACDVDGGSPVVRLAICGRDRCKDTFAPVAARAGDKAPNRLWTIVHVDEYGTKVDGEGQRAWAYRGRPVYTYAEDRAPGEMNAGGLGNFWHGGYRVLRVQDDLANSRGRGN